MMTAPPGFERQLKLVMPRLKLEYRYWKARPEDRNGDTFWSPFGPPAIRASNAQGQVGVRLQASSEWTLVHPDRVTSGRWVILEDVEGKLHHVYDICAADSGYVPLDERTLQACRVSCDNYAEWRRAAENRFKEAEVDVASATGRGNEAGAPIPTVIYRDAAQQQWRADAEAQVAELASYEYNRAFAKYQFDPTSEPAGERHPAGFIVTDRRAVPTSGLA